MLASNITVDGGYNAIFNPIAGGSTIYVQNDNVKNAIDEELDGSIYDPNATRIVVRHPGSSSVTMYRLYNPNSGEHFYTGSTAERDHLVSVGWRYEGTGWTAPKTSKTPVYRLYNPNAGDHHYTTSAAERDMLRRAGWNYEGIGWYSDDAKTVPVYREYNPNAKAGAHNFTTSKAEDQMLANSGWRQEGIAWYGVKR